MILGFVRRGSWAGQAAQRTRVQHLADRAVQLEDAAERLKLAGNEEMAASFAKQATELRRAGA